MNDTWTIKSIINWTSNYFKKYNIDASRLTAELLLAKALNKNRLYLYTNFELPLTKEELSNFKKLIKRRLQGEPTHYIIGSREFWSLEFKVDKNVLIPRPETEVLIEKIVEYAKCINNKIINILEIGTGCGNIAVSLAKELKNAKIFSIDKSFPALNIAKYNILNHKVEENVYLINGDILEPVKLEKQFDIIVSNPPYIKTDELKFLQKEVKDFEPMLALNGGIDGMFFYMNILNHSKRILKENGRIFFEFGTKEQGEKISQFMKKLNFKNIEIFKDYSNNERVISCSNF